MNKMTEKTAYRTMFKDYPEVVTVKELCEMLNLSDKTIYKLIRNGVLQRIPGCHTIKVVRITVIEYVLQSTQ